MNDSNKISIIVSQLLFFLSLPVLVQLFSYLHPVVIVVVWMCLTAGIFFVVYWLRKESIHLSPSFFYTFFGLYSISLLVLLYFRPSDQSYENWNLEPFSTINFYFSGRVAPLIAVYNLTANIGLFIPFGILLMMLHLSLLQRIFLPLPFIAMIELLQFVTHRGSLDIDDLILNLLGVYIGCFLYPLFNRVVKM